MGVFLHHATWFHTKLKNKTKNIDLNDFTVDTDFASDIFSKLWACRVSHLLIRFHGDVCVFSSWKQSFCHHLNTDHPSLNSSLTSWRSLACSCAVVQVEASAGGGGLYGSRRRRRSRRRRGRGRNGGRRDRGRTRTWTRTWGLQTEHVWLGLLVSRKLLAPPAVSELLTSPLKALVIRAVREPHGFFRLRRS